MVNTYMPFDRHLSLGVMLAQMNLGELRSAVALQPYILPDAGRRELRPPVPAEVAGRFAQVRPAGDRLRHARQGTNGLLLRHVLDRRIE